MAFVHGKTTKVFANGFDLSAYFRQSTISGEADTAETTCYGATNKAYIAGHKDGTISLEGIFDSSVNAIDQLMEASLGLDGSIFSVFPEGDALGVGGYAIKGISTQHEIDTPVDDVVSVAEELQASGGVDRVVSLHPMGADTATGNGTAVDGLAETTNGGVGYLHVAAFSGFTNVIYKIQDSADGTTGWADILTFATVTGVTKEKIEITGTVRRHLRAVRTFSGGGPGTATASVAFGRK